MNGHALEIDNDVELTQAEEAELKERIAEVERGEFVDGDEIIRRLRSGYYAPADHQRTRRA